MKFAPVYQLDFPKLLGLSKHIWVIGADLKDLL